VTVGTSMAALDDRVLIVGLPTIAKDLGANVNELIWTSQAYAFATGLGILLLGRVADLLGRVKIYTIGFVIFTLGSALAAISFSSTELIAARVIQGAGGAALLANSLAIITDATPRGELGSFVGLNQIAGRIGSISGFTLTGILIAFASWRAIFYINIPIGIFGTLWARKWLREISTKDTTTKGMDWPGFIVFTTGLALLLTGLSLLNYGVSLLVESVGVMLCGAVVLVAFVSIERRAKAPLLDLRLFKIRAFGGGTFAALLEGTAWQGMLFITSLFMQIALGFSALQAGLGFIPLEVMFILVGPLSGRLSDRYSSRALPTIGILVSATAFFLSSTFSDSTTYAMLVVPLVMLGMGQGMFISPNSRSVMYLIPSDRRGVASGFLRTFTKLGDTAGPGIAITLITLGIPYLLFTSLIQGSGAIVGVVARDQFVSGFKIATVGLGLISLCAAAISYWAGKEKAEAPMQSEAKTSLT
jgi:EmrB/QacA subfamily drug resistance transporter